MKLQTKANLEAVLGDMPQIEINFYKPMNETDI